MRSRAKRKRRQGEQMVGKGQRYVKNIEISAIFSLPQMKHKRKG